MKALFSEGSYHKLFKIGVVLKGIEGALETAAGLLFAFVNADFIVNVAASLTQEELAEDSRDIAANFLLHWSQGMTLGVKSFIAAFLFVHGIVNLALVLGITKKKLWAYRGAGLVFSLFLLYQIYRVTYAYSLILVGAMIFDAVLVALLIHEYKRHRSSLK